MSTVEGVISCPVCSQQYTTPPGNFVTNRIVLDIVEEMQKAPQLNKNVAVTLCHHVVTFGVKLLLCTLVFVLFKPFCLTIGRHITTEGCCTVMRISFY